MTVPTGFDARTVAGLLAEYDGFGVRRAGTAGDQSCAAWQLEIAARSGARTTRREITLPVVAVREAFLEWSTGRIDGLPMFDSPDTPEDGIAGALSTPEGGGPVGLLEVDPGAASIKGQPLEAMRRATAKAALVLATRGAGGSLAPINAQYFEAPFGPPVLQVAGFEYPALAELVKCSEPVRVTVRTERIAGRSCNVEARIGSAPDRVLLTPRTSWWESTAERAGGIVAWLAGVHAAREHRVDVHAFSTCGHELGHIGLASLLRDQQALLTRGVTWLHLGANLGCASDPKVTLRATDPTDARALQGLLMATGYPSALIEIETIDRAMGEARDLDQHGAKVVSLIGRNGHFHAPSDRWPGNVNAGLVASIAQAVQAWVIGATGLR